MNDIAACEQRLGVALDRIDYGLDRLFAAMRRAGDAATAPAIAPTTLPEAEPAASDDMAALRRRQETALERARQRLAAAGAEAARLAAANDALIAANRALIEAGDTPERLDAVRKALDAEIEALQAARAAEIAQMGDILAALETMLGIPETAPLPPDMPAEVPQAGFDGDVELLPQEGRILRFGTSGEDDEGAR